MNIPQIDIQKKQDWPTHIDNMIREFPVMEYSNLNLKWIEIVQRIENVNDLLTDLFNDYLILKSTLHTDPITDSIFKTPLYYKQKFLTEQIFYWIRKTIDEMISMIYVLEYEKENKSFPIKIKIDCIGQLFHNPNFIREIQIQHKTLLVIINDISNTYKHSFLNSEVHSYIGELEPLVFSYGFKNNNLEKDMIFSQYRVRYIINELNVLISNLIEYITKV